MSSTTATSNLTAGFIDLATFDEPEKYMYGGPRSLSYFVRRIRKSTWFTTVPVILTNIGSTPNFNTQFDVNISRAGDYLLNAWFRVDFPSVTIASTNQFGVNGRLRWTRNLMHNLVNEIALTFNDLVEMRFDNFYMDNWAAFTVPAGKRNGYNNMIGNIDDLINPIAAVGVGGGLTLPATTLNLPLPMCHSRDTGVSLPTAAIPYNEMRFRTTFRNWNQLLILDNILSGVSTQPTNSDVSAIPSLGRVQLWAEYALVSNDERKRMGAQIRDILIEQVQTVQPVGQSSAIAQGSVSAPQSIHQDIRLSHSVKELFFGLQNTTNPAEWSNYTAASPVPTAAGVIFSPALASDPMSTISVVYENTQRLSQMGSDYYSLVQPYYKAISIPTDTGFHLYSYSNDIVCIDPMGSTNYGKLTNTALEFIPSSNAITAAQSVGTVAIPDPAHLADGAAVKQTFALYLVAVNNNIVRVSGGALGFPVL